MRLERILLGTFFAALACGEPADDCSYRINVDDDILCPGDNRIAIDDNGNGCIDRCSYVISEGVDTSSDVGGYDSGVDTAPEGLEIVGEYVTSNGAVFYTITPEMWVADNPDTEPLVTFSIHYFDNDEDYVILRDDTNWPDNPERNGRYSRTKWIQDGSNLYICHSFHFGTRSLEDALQIPDPILDPFDNDTCYDWIWVHLVPN
jgi:hypothetical protein